MITDLSKKRKFVFFRKKKTSKSKKINVNEKGKNASDNVELSRVSIIIFQKSFPI